MLVRIENAIVEVQLSAALFDRVIALLYTGLPTANPGIPKREIALLISRLFKHSLIDITQATVHRHDRTTELINEVVIFDVLVAPRKTFSLGDMTETLALDSVIYIAM
jgi:hypothetical protein